MPTAESTFTIATGTGAQQAYDFCAGLATLMEAAGWEQVQEGAHTGTNHRKTYRSTSTDIHRTDVGMVGLVSVTTNAYIECLTDFDIYTEASVVYTSANRHCGDWTTSGFPTTGAPQASTGAISGVILVNFTTTTAQTISVHAIADELGLFVCYDSSGGSLKGVAAVYRPMGQGQTGREIYLDGAITSSFTHPAKPLVTFPHATSLTFVAMGETITPTFPTGTPLTPWQICRIISSARPGLLEAYPIKAKGDQGAWTIRVRIPPTQAASAAFSIASTRNSYRLQLAYQHASLPAAGLSFALDTNTAFTSVGTGTRAKLGLASGSFVELGVRPGSIIYNRTTTTTAEVEAFGSLGTGFVDTDVLYVDANPSDAWTSGHAYDIYPVCDYATGCDSRSGHSQIVDAASPASDIGSSAATTVLCCDIFGEMYDHFTVGQRVLISNNGCAQVLTLSATPTVEVGEVIDGSDGSRGVVRGIDGNDIVVDTIKGPTIATNPPWEGTISRNSDPDNPRAGGVTTGIAISARAAGANAGWTTWAVILSKSVSDAANGDYRTRLVIQTNQNASFVVSPGATIGSSAKTRIHWDRESSTLGPGTVIFPWLTTTAPTGEVAGVDLRGSEAISFTGEPNYAPDDLAGSTDLGEIWIRSSALGVRGKAQLFGSCPHLKSINNGTVTTGDVLVEDGDPDRQWLVKGFSHTDTGAGGANGNNAGVMCIGPGTSSFTGSGI